MSANTAQGSTRSRCGQEPEPRFVTAGPLDPLHPADCGADRDPKTPWVPDCGTSLLRSRLRHSCEDPESKAWPSMLACNPGSTVNQKHIDLERRVSQRFDCAGSVGCRTYATFRLSANSVVFARHISGSSRAPTGGNAGYRDCVNHFIAVRLVSRRSHEHILGSFLEHTKRSGCRPVWNTERQPNHNRL
ncbi:hypothetical protein GGD66_006184 [Bradyrhizobium sp. CIR48]|nr:hypothetical protein [Bradyrhizobium sp. CIR48]